MQSSNPDQNQKETPSTSSAPGKIVELIVDKLASGMSHFQVEIAVNRLKFKKSSSFFRLISMPHQNDFIGVNGYHV